MQPVSPSIMPNIPPANVFARAKMAALNFFTQKPAHSRLDAPIVSFSFDDFPKSAASLGAQIMEDAGLLATYYLTGSNCQNSFENIEQYDASDVLRLHKAGHEIACHSFGHPRLRARSQAEIENDLSQNLAFAKNLLGQDFEFENFAYPYGEFDALSRKIMGQKFTTARGVYRGVNKGTMDFANLRTVPLERRRFSREYLAKYIKDAITNKGWIIFFTHDVGEECSDYGSTPAILHETIAAVRAANIEVLTVKDAAKVIMASCQS